MCYVIINYVENTFLNFIENGEPVWTENVSEMYKTYSLKKANAMFDLLKDDYEVSLLSVDVLR